MGEDIAHSAESDFSMVNVGIVKIYCKECKKTTSQNFLGLEFYSRKIASRCLECRGTNFQEEVIDHWRNRAKKEVKVPVKEIEEEKIKIFGAKKTDPFEDLEDALEIHFY